MLIFINNFNYNPKYRHSYYCPITSEPINGKELFQSKNTEEPVTRTYLNCQTMFLNAVRYNQAIMINKQHSYIC